MIQGLAIFRCQRPTATNNQVAAPSQSISADGSGQRFASDDYRVIEEMNAKVRIASAWL